ncbi:hypothetical protein FAIPA1_30179 [Frankia sp. AiPs1]
MRGGGAGGAGAVRGRCGGGAGGGVVGRRRELCVWAVVLAVPGRAGAWQPCRGVTGRDTDAIRRSPGVVAAMLAEGRPRQAGFGYADPRPAPPR